MNKIQNRNGELDKNLYERLEKMIQYDHLRDFICIDGPEAYEIHVPEEEPFEGMKLKLFKMSNNPKPDDIVPKVTKYILKTIHVDFQQFWFWQHLIEWQATI